MSTSDAGASGQRIILGLGSGRCGTHTLATVLNNQPGAEFTHEQRPLMSWYAKPGSPGVAERLRRFRRTRRKPFIGDVASFYLPHVEAAIAAEPDIRLICLERPREEVVESFCRWLDKAHPLPTDHWSRTPAPGWHHDPTWTRMFPKYDVGSREEGIRRYWDDYARTVAELARRHPENLRVFPMAEALNSESGMRALLTFAGFPEESHFLTLQYRDGCAEAIETHHRREVATSCGPDDPRRCAVLVLHRTPIAPACEAALKSLECRGYFVQRIPGNGPIEVLRNKLITDILMDGLEETVWIGPSIGFNPEDIDRLRACGEPIVCGLYPQGPQGRLSCEPLPGSQPLVLGAGGGLSEVLYAAAGFLLVRRQVYMDILNQFDLPLCNEEINATTIPFFLPAPCHFEDGCRILPDSYAFCDHARRCGHRILADTRIRLWNQGIR